MVNARSEEEGLYFHIIKSLINKQYKSFFLYIVTELIREHVINQEENSSNVFLCFILIGHISVQYFKYVFLFIVFTVTLYGLVEIKNKKQPLRMYKSHIQLTFKKIRTYFHKL